MTLSDLTKRLCEGGIREADVEARLLISHFCGVSPAALLAERTRNYESEALKAAVARRLNREPLAHILGEVGFFEETYFVSPDCLIPRADTELLVEKAIALLPHGARFADFCTGSGCIAVSVLAHRPDLSALAVDLSDAALALAKKNAARNGVADRIDLLKDDILSPAHLKNDFDVILSNPPYIRTEVVPTLAPELAYEPKIALDGGEDGLLFYRALFGHFSPSLFLLEIGFDQGEDIARLGKEQGYAVTVERDLGGNNRLAILKK